MKKYIIILTTLVSLLFMSCNPDGIGIFYKISVEPALSTSALSEKSVYKIVELSGTKYVLAGGTVYKENGSDWAALATPSGETQAVSLLSDGTTIFTVYADNSNSSLYELSGSTWITATNTASLNNSNDLILIEGNSSYFFICEETTPGHYNISSYTTATNTLTDVTSSDITLPVIDGAYDGTNYYLISSNYTGSSEIYTTNGTSNINAISGTTTGFDYTKALGGIIANGSDLYISNRSGILNKSVDGTTWTAVNTTALANTKLGDMAIVDIGGTNYLLIASNGGFYEMNLSGGTPVSPTAATIGSTVYESVNLYTELVYSIFSSSAANTFYIGSSNGLWYSDTNELTIK